MAESSRRAARAVARGGLPNAMFVVAAAEQPPVELVGIADALTIYLPWGSLLRGALAIHEAAACGIVALLRPGGRATALISVTPRDGLGLASALDEPGAREALADRWARHGLRLEAFCSATDAEIEGTGSSWARRLRAGRSRPVWRLELRRVTAPGAADDGLAHRR
jgi:16S rRNA (adenine(1408)-N(1))-methyltransferase